MKRVFATLLMLGLCACGTEQPVEPQAHKKESALDVIDPTPLPSLPKSWVYGIAQDGLLYCYRHNSHLTGLPNWDYGLPVGQGWNVHQAFAGAGAMYVIYANGELWWFKHTGYDSCAPNWSAGKRIGTGWHSFNQVVAVGDGVIYAFQTDGLVRWYRHLGYADGAMSWAAGSGKFVATMSGPIDYQLKVFSPGGGALYMHEVGSDKLRWARQKNYLTGQNARTSLHNLRSSLMAYYWSVYDFDFGWVQDPQFTEFSTTFAGPDGAIYGIKPNGDLIWNRFLDYEFGLPRQTFQQYLITAINGDGRAPIISGDPALWAGPTLVGTGWDVFNTTFARQE